MMKTFDRERHWESIYQTKSLEEVGWYQVLPQPSLDLISKLSLAPDDPLIDIGGGDSLLVDHLLDRGHTDLTVLDISGLALDRARKRLGNLAARVHWIQQDITPFTPPRSYACWHDRAAFHFLVNDVDVSSYKEVMTQSLRPEGKAILGVFSDEGPTKCSGIPIRQYTEQSLERVFSDDFEMIDSLRVDHKTPGGAIQNYVFGVFIKNP